MDYTVKKNISNLSDYLNKNPENLTACILDRPRHKEIMEELKKLKVNLKLITDGDVSGALLVTEEKYNVDIFLGIGRDDELVKGVTNLLQRIVFEEPRNVNVAPDQNDPFYNF